MYKSVQANYLSSITASELGPANLNCGMARIYCGPSDYPNFTDQIALSNALLNLTPPVEPLPYWEYERQDYIGNDAGWKLRVGEWVDKLGMCTYFEVGNEPGRTDNVSQARSLQMFRMAYPLIVAAGKKPILAAAQKHATITYLTTANNNPDYLTDPTAAKGPLLSGASPLAIEGVGVHCYHNDADTLFGQFTAARTALNSHTLTPNKIPIWITEMGLGTDAAKGTNELPASDPFDSGSGGDGYRYKGPDGGAGPPPQVTNAVVKPGGVQIRLTVVGHGLVTNDIAVVMNVGGTTEANGLWRVTKIDNDTIDLQSSTFTNAYTSGGTCRRSPTPNPFIKSEAGQASELTSLYNQLYAVRTTKNLRCASWYAWKDVGDGTGENLFDTYGLRHDSNNPPAPVPNSPKASWTAFKNQPPRQSV
jgi:hypothetical protein